MANHDLLLLSIDQCGAAESYPSLDTLIRPGLRLAFPLPAESKAADEKFRLLLEAIATRWRD